MDKDDRLSIHFLSWHSLITRNRLLILLGGWLITATVIHHIQQTGIKNDQNIVFINDGPVNSTRAIVKPKFGAISKMGSSNSSVNVLVLAYQRSGSSFLGEILSASPDAMYIFEPLIELSCKRNIRNPETIREFIKKVLSCDSESLDVLGPSRRAKIQMLRKRASLSSCQQARTRVMKTIRLRLDVAKKLLDDKDLNLRIVHLVRDPRAILNSMNESDTWKPFTKTPSVQCEHVMRDLQSSAGLPSDRYIRVRYEDLVQDPLGVAVNLYKFLGLPLHKRLAFYIATHTEAERFFRHSNSQYFTTYRESKFTMDSWKTKLTKEMINTIQDNHRCKEIMKELGYAMFDSKRLHSDY